ncbi:MAG: DNA mismatch repair protein MutS [Alphaproteobacteria bacterium]|nr:DNA mismatch repair protein MutS [Alphaproteobacteria bacterium]
MAKQQSDATPSVKQYLDIKKEYEQYLLFYRMGDFYELFFEDAVAASKALDLVLTKRGTYMGKDIPMCGVPFHAYENYLARLIHQGFKVAICEQMETPDEAKKRGKSLVSREVVRIVTAGTLTEDNMLNPRENNYLLSIFKKENMLGFAWIDISTGQFCTKSVNSDFYSFAADIYNVLSKIEPSEIIVSDELLTLSEIFRVLNIYQDRRTVLPKERFNTQNAALLIKKVFGIDSLDSFGAFEDVEISAAGIVLEYIENTQKGQMPRINPPVRQNSNNSLEIDVATRKNLELLVGADGSKKNSLLGTIDETITSSGARLFKQRLIYPSIDEKEINSRLNCVEFFISCDDLGADFRALLKDVSDMQRIITRLSASRGGPKDMLALKISLSCVPKIKNMIYNAAASNSLITGLVQDVKNILDKMADFSALVDNLENAIIDNPLTLPSNPKDGGFVKYGYSAVLDSYRDIGQNHAQTIKQMEAQYTKELNISSLKIKYNNMIGYYIEVPNKFIDTVVQNNKFIHRQTVLNAMRFTTVELSELEQQINVSQNKILETELQIYQDLTRQILSAATEISQTAMCIGELDIAAAGAHIALSKNYTRPIVDSSLEFEIKEGRHPVVEAALKKNNEASFVSNDCVLNVKTNRLWLLTGPNMAGKSTFLRQNAIIAIMAQMGFYVPAAAARIGIIDKLFSRVGASDDLSQGRSTFMVEMVETAAILNQSTPKSFVILDEIGRGTATYDGLSIAWSVVEYLHEVNKCRALFATHYHELTVLSQKLKALTLHAMKIKEYQGSVVFMHEVIDGTADRSYGIHVAELAGLPKVVIKRAEQVLKTLEKNPNSQKITSIENDLPLFANLQQSLNKQEDEPFIKALKDLNPDNLTPREALDKLYELKVLAKGYKN